MHLPSRPTNLYVRSALLAVVAILAFAAVAFAAWVTINPNNSAVDSGWGAPFYSSTCSNGSLDDGYEIRDAYLANDGTNIYFRMTTCGVPGSSQLLTRLRIAGAIDCNNDGDVDDPASGGPQGDRVGVYAPNGDGYGLYDGTNVQVAGLSPNLAERINPPGVDYELAIPLEVLYPGCRGSTSTIGLGLGTVEVTAQATPRDETPLVQWNIPIDYGDLPNPNPSANPPTCEQYPTRIGCNGARHGIVQSGARLGSLIDADAGNLFDTNATADDLDNQADEDGVAPTPGFVWSQANGGSLDVFVSNASSANYLSCWIDWNNNSSLTDAGEQILNDQAVTNGLNTVTFAVPLSSVANASLYARCRLAPSQNTADTPTGPVEGGEVEDHLWSFGPNAVSLRNLRAAAPFPVWPVALAVGVALIAAGWLLRSRRAA